VALTVASTDARPINLLSFQTVLFTNASKRIPHFKAYVTQAKSNPGKLTNAPTGSAQILTLATELLKSSAGIDVLQIPFTSSAPALQAVLAGDVDSALLDAGGAAPFIKNGKLTPLAVLGKSRISA
jgi:tripartite-type tricarboxylate transporter receptor subunit TctC